MGRFLVLCGIVVLAMNDLGAQVKPLIELVRVDGGRFMMGKTDTTPGVPTSLEAFWIGKYEVTQGQWSGIMNTNPSGHQGPRLPVENVSWFDAVEFCNRLSKREGLSPGYSVQGTLVSLNPGASGYRLPSEAQWEFAARGGNASRGLRYSGSSEAHEVGWNSSNSHFESQEVGTRAPNELGIYDMSGNIWEWVEDQFFATPSTIITPFVWTPPSPARILKGGC